MELNPDKHRLPAAQLREIFERRIRPVVFRGVVGAPPGTNPKAIIFGGQPGAGKSAAMASAVRELGGDRSAVEIVGDDLRPYHPAYRTLMAVDDKTAAFYTDRDSAQWIEMSIDLARTLRVPVAVEGTMRNAEKVAQTLQLFRQAQYLTEARALAVPFEQSWLGVMLRYEKQRNTSGYGRMTTPEAHQVAYDAIPATLDRIERDRSADIISVYGRDDQLLYRNDTSTGSRSAPTSAREVLEGRRRAPWPDQELRQQLTDIEQLRQLLARPERRATPKEVAAVLSLARDARAASTPAATRAQDLDRPR